MVRGSSATCNRCDWSYIGHDGDDARAAYRYHLVHCRGFAQTPDPGAVTNIHTASWARGLTPNDKRMLTGARIAVW